MKFFRNKKTRAKEGNEGIRSEFVQSLDFDSSYEDIFGDEQPDSTTIYDLEGNVIESDAEESDTYNLQRFVDAQACYHDIALGEVKAGLKRSHWMWYIFPQIIGLGNSWKAEKYSIACLDEAIAYMQHPLLGPRLVEMSKAVLEVPEGACLKCFGTLDYMKLCSCMTLFAEACPAHGVFQEVLDKFYNGERDEFTLRILKDQARKL